MSFFKADCYRVKTFLPDWKEVNIEGDKEYATLVAAQKAGTLKDLYPDRSAVNRHARNFHVAEMLMNEDGITIKDECIGLHVPKFLPDGSLNVEGIIDLKTEEEAIRIINTLKKAGRKVELDTNFGKDLQDRSKLVEAPKVKETVDIMHGKSRKKDNR